MNTDYWELLTECAEIAQERWASYWDILNNFQDICKILQVNYWLVLKPSDIIKVMIATKISRQKNKHKKDNLVDNINYTAILLYFLENEFYK